MLTKTISQKLESLKACPYTFENAKAKGYTTPNALLRAQKRREAWEKKDFNSYAIASQTVFNPANKKGERWIENVSQALRFTGKAHELIRLDHTGWYNDSCYDSLSLGVVYQLPSRKGVNQYVAGVLDPYNDDCAILDFRNREDSKEEAARRADSMAESYAKECREFDAKDRAEQETEELKTEISEIRKSIISVCQEARAIRDSEICKKAGNILEFAKLKAKELLRDKRKKEKRIESLQENFWLAVENW